MILEIYLIPAAQVRLAKITEETGRSVKNLAASAVEEAALDYFRHRDDDPARLARRPAEAE